MKPIRRGELEDNISSAIVTFSDTGETIELNTRVGSACHFFDLFTVCGDEIQLRLDWSDLDNDGHPMLDADFINNKTRKHRKLKGKRRVLITQLPYQARGVVTNGCLTGTIANLALPSHGVQLYQKAFASVSLAQLKSFPQQAGNPRTANP